MKKAAMIFTMALLVAASTSVFAEEAPAIHADNTPVCTSGEVIDLTPDFNLEPLASKLTLVSSKSDKVKNNQKVSRAVYEFGAGDQRIAAEVTCTLTCTGSSCSMSGCDAWGGGCTSYSCSGFDCNGGSCTKTSKEIQKR